MEQHVNQFLKQLEETVKQRARHTRRLALAQF